MGDEVHNRNAAATALFFKRIAPALIEAEVSRADAAATLDFIAGNDHFFLNLSMAACKAMLDAAAGVAGSSHGHGDGAQRRQLRHPPVRAPATPGSRRRPTRSTACTFPATRSPMRPPTWATRAITETAGVGGFAMAAAPAIVKFVGGTPDRRDRTTACACAPSRSARNPSFTLPALDFAAARPRIDARKVVDCGVLPVINSGIAHREAGVGQIGAGVTTRADGLLHRSGQGAGAQPGRRSGGADEQTSGGGRGRRQRADPRRPAHDAGRPVRRRLRDRRPRGRRWSRPAGTWC